MITNLHALTQSFRRYPEWLLERRRAARTLATVVATGYLLGVSIPIG